MANTLAFRFSIAPLALVAASPLAACSAGNGSGARPGNDGGVCCVTPGSSSSGGGSSSGSSGGAGSGGSPGGAAGCPSSAGGGGTSQEFFLDHSPTAGDKSVSNASVAIDAQGGMHVAYLSSPTRGGYAVRYGYCASSCGQLSSWTSVSVPGAGTTSEGPGTTSGVAGALAVDPQGHPRLFSGSNSGFAYSECNGNCTSASGWTTVAVGPAKGGIHPAFAVDAQGRAAFAYLASGGKSSAFVSCAANCTTATSWQTTQLPATTATLGVFKLALSATGAAYVAAERLGSGGGVDLFECDSNCSAASSWNQGALTLASAADSGAAPLGSSAFSLALDSQGRPRLAVAGSPGLYAWCDGSCTSAQSWQASPLGSNCKGTSLAIDAQDNPHVAYDEVRRLHYDTCTSGCNSPSATWERATLDGDPQASAPITDNVCQYPAPGSSGVPSWSGGSDIALAVGASGAAIVAQAFADYDLCLEDDIFGNSNPKQETNASGVFLRVGSGGPASTPSCAAASSSGGSSGSSSDAGGSSSGSGSSGSSVGMDSDNRDLDAGSGDSSDGNSDLSKFAGTWSGSEVASAQCGDAGAVTTKPQSTSGTFQATSTGLTMTDPSGCTFDFTISGAVATLSAPVSCDTDSGVVQVSSFTLTTTDGHHMTGQATAIETVGAVSCAATLSVTFTR